MAQKVYDKIKDIDERKSEDRRALLERLSDLFATKYMELTAGDPTKASVDAFELDAFGMNLISLADCQKIKANLAAFENRTDLSLRLGKLMTLTRKNSLPAADPLPDLTPVSPPG
jgi:hypothetical protein